MLNQSSKPPRRRGEGWLGAIPPGFFLILAGSIFILTPSLIDKTISFFQDFNVTKVPNTPWYLVAPLHPETHAAIYSAVQLFTMIWGVFLIAMMALRVFYHSPLGKKTENVGDIIFWLGTTYLINMHLNESTTMTTWFIFWTEILMLIGVSLIVRAAILAIARPKPQTLI